MQFDALEIQKIIEEKRLIFGKKIEEFLMKKLIRFFAFCGKVFAAKPTALVGSIIIIAASILAQSSRDLGHDSATYLEIAEKMLAGGKYYYDFFESNLPLNFLLTMIPVLLAKFFDFNQIASAEIFWNLLGILSIYSSNRILLRSEFVKDTAVLNLIILTFAAGFFWRVFTLQFNEFGTKTTYLLAVVLPYISYHLLNEANLKKSDQILIGILAALLFCLKPHYGIFVITFELAKMLKLRSFFSVFCLRNYVTLALLICYLSTLFRFFPDYISNISNFASAYYGNSHNLTFYVFTRDLFPIFLLIILCFDLLKKEEIARRLFLPIGAAAFLVLLELIGGLDQRFVFYSLSLPLTALTILFLCRNHFVNWRRDGFLLASILLLPQFDPQSTFFVLTNVSCFWMIFLPIIWKKINRVEKLCFIALAPLTFLSLLNSDLVGISLAVSAIILVFILFLGQKFYQKKELSRLSACSVFLVLSYLISLHIASIFDLKTSPTHFTSEIVKLIKHYSNKDESVVSISPGIQGTYPMIRYAGKKNELPFLQYGSLFEQIDGNNKTDSEYVMSRLKEQLKSPNNKLVFVEIWRQMDDKKCSIKFLEYYFRDAEFKKIFLENYVFLTRITEINKLSGGQDEIDRDAEVYIRK
jgi:hypothetical protein